jgi:hypothetical protein
MAAFIEFESSNKPLATPSAMVAKDGTTMDRSPAAHELNDLQWGTKLTGPSISDQAPSTPSTPRELEQSAPPSPMHENAVDVTQSVRSPPMNRWRVGAYDLTFFTTGVNDSAPGALIPYLEKDYKVGYVIMSLIFLINSAGFISAAPSVQVI